MERAEIRLKNETVAAYHNYLISRGMPLPPGKVREPREVSIRDAQGRCVPSAGKVLQRRPDGSIEWLLLDFLSDFASEESKSFFLETRPGEAVAVAHPVRVEQSGDAIRLSNGITEVVLSRTGGSLIRRWVTHGKELVGPGQRVDLEVLDPEGKVYRASVADAFQATVIHENPLKATVKIEGKHVARDGSTFLDFALRVTLTANRADVGFQHTFYCRENRNGVIEVKAMRFVLPTRMSPTARKLFHQSHHGHSWWPRYVSVPENVEVVASSVNDINQYPRDYKPHKMGTLFLRNFSSLKEQLSDYPFHMKPQGGSEFRADHMTGGVRQVYPWIGWQQEDLTLVFGMRYWTQLHPKSVSIDEGLLVVSIWPEWSVPMRIVQGVSKSHDFWVTAEPAALTAEQCEHKALHWQIKDLVEPIEITIDPAWPAHCRAMDCHRLLRYQPGKYSALENRISASPGEPSRFTYARNVGNGMFNFACVDYGAPSWGNNEDDRRVFVPLRDYLRTGRMFHFDWGMENALHYMEVDFCEWSTDPRQNGGLIPHTVDHFIGCVYPSHQWAEGILAFYYLTGDERARNVVLRCGDNNVYWAHNVLEAVVCDGREAGIPLVNLAAAYRLNPDEKYLRAARVIIANFHQKWFDRWGDLKYPYPQGAHLQWITGYGDYSSYYGLYRIWEVSGDTKVRDLLVNLLKPMMSPERFSINDSRMMDFFAVWAYIDLTGDKSVLKTLKAQIDNFVAKGGHEMRRLEMLKVLDEEGMIPPG